MKFKITFVIITLIRLFSSIIAQTYVCPSTPDTQWVLQGQHCFYPSTVSTLTLSDSWSNAESTCTGLVAGSHLAYLLNSSLLSDFNTYRNTYFPSDKVWIGCSKSGPSYVWSYDGSTVTWKPTGSWPKSGHNYCFSDTDGSNTWNTDYSSASYKYICMCNAEVAIDPATVTFNQYTYTIVLGSSVSFGGPSFAGQDALTYYVWNFGNGVTSNTTMSNFSATYTYTVPGTYYVSMIVGNGVSGPFTIGNITVNVVSSCHIVSCTVIPAATNTASQFTIGIDHGIGCTITIDFKDGTAAQTVGTYASEASLCTSLLPGCGSVNGQWTTKYNHTYTTANIYSAIVSSSNGLSTANTTCTAVVQDPIVGFAITSPTTYNYYAYSTPITVSYAATAGTGAIITITIDSNNPVGTWSNTTLTGSVVLTSSNMNGVGPKIVTVQAANLISNSTAVTYQFQVEFMFTGFQTNPSPAYISTTNTNNFQISWANASHFNCTVDFAGAAALYSGYNYNLVISNYNNWISAGVPHYSAPGTYAINVSAWNHVDSFNQLITVTAQDPVCCVNFVVDSVGILGSSSGSSADAVFSILWTDVTKPWPTNAQYTINFGVSPSSQLTGQTYLNDTNQTLTYTYTASNAYTINITVYNLVSSVTFTKLIYVAVKFVNPYFDMHRYLPYTGFEPHKYYLLTNEIAQFQTTLTDGTVFNMTINFQDNTPPYVIYQVTSNALYYNHSFAQAGNYNVTMHLKNVADDVLLTLPVPSPYPTYLIVQDPIQCFIASLAEGVNPVIKYATRSNGVTVHMEISTNNSCGSTGTNPRYIIDWGDGTTGSNGSIPNANVVTSVPHIYNSSNIFNLKVIVWNEANSETFYWSIHVYNEITSVSILARWVNTSNNNVMSEGYYPTPTKAYFDMFYPVQFDASKLFGSYESYSWSWDDGYSTTSTPNITRQFTQIGTYVLTLSITNQPSAGTFSFTCIVEVATVNPNISDNSPFPIFQKPYQQYSLSMDVVGTDSCYFLNLNDPPISGVKSDCDIVLFGDKTMCEEFFPKYFTHPPTVVCTDFNQIKSSDLEQPFSGSYSGKSQDYGTINNKAYINFTHQFAKPGAHIVTFIVVNHVYNKTFYYRSVVSKGWCSFPIVFVKDMNKCQSSDTCKCFFNAGPNYICMNTASDMNNGNRVVYMKDQVLVDADVTINCTSSPNIWFNWTLHQLDLTVPGKVIANSTQLLDKLDYQSYRSKVLVVPPNWLPGGRYNFTLTVSPADEVDLDRTDSTIIFLQASNLLAKFVGNASGIHVPQNQKILFDAWTESYDPDFDQYNKTNLKFAFYCRRLCESWPTVLVDQTYTNWPVFDTSTCTASDNAAKGCFTSGSKGPMQLSGTAPNGQWQLTTSSQGYTGGNITIDTSYMVPGVWYSLMVVLSKVNDTRISYSELFFYVSPASSVPVVTFNCVTNCQKSYSTLNNTNSGRYYNRVNPTSRFSIEAIIDNFDMATTYFYQWDLIQRATDKHNNTFSAQNVILVPPTEWVPNATTGNNIRTMSLAANWYSNDTRTLPGFYLCLTLWVNNMKTGPTGQYLYEFFLNNPPDATHGSCNPTEPGVALSPTFAIMCKGYVDSNNADLFYFVKQIDTTNADFWLDIGSSKTSMMPDYNIYVNAAPGIANTSYLTQFKVRVIDSSGSYIDVFTNGSMQPFDLDYPHDNAVWSILNYTATCPMCQYEDFYLQMTKIQRCVNVSAVVRTFANMLNQNPSTGCLPVLCDNTTSAETNCTIGEDIEVTTMAPDVVPYDVAPLVKSAIGDVWLTYSTCRLDLQLRIYIRERLMSLFASLKIPYFSNFVVVVSALYPVTLIPQENTIKIMQDVETTLREGIAHLDGIDPQLSVTLEADVREEVCKMVNAIVGNMEKTTNYYGAIWRDYLRVYYPFFSMDGLVGDIARLDSMVSNGTNVSYLTFQFDETNPIWLTVGNGTLDPETTNVLQITRFNITLITVILNHIRNLKTNVTNYVQARKVMAEAPSVLLTTNLTSVYHKTAVKNMTAHLLTGLGGCQFMSGNAAEMFGDLNSLEESVMGAVECAHNNPFTTDMTSVNLTGTVSMSFQNSAGAIPVGNLTKPIDVFIPRHYNKSELSPIWNTTEPFSKPMVVYTFSLPQYRGISFSLYDGWVDLPPNATVTNSSVEEATSTASTTTTAPLTTTTITVGNGSDESGASGSKTSKETKFVMFFKFWSMFDIDNKYHFYCIAPQWNDTDYDPSAYPTKGDPRTCTVSWNQALGFADLTDNNPSAATSINVFVAVQPLPQGYTISDFMNTTRISSYDDEKFVPEDYTLFAIVAGCMYYDDVKKIWSYEGTDIGPNTTRDITHCRTTHLTSFSSSFSVPTNSLNLQDSAFLHLAENPIAFVFCMCLFCLYLILFVWCRRKDKEDLKKAGIAPLPDNDPRDRYLYQIVFYTASRPDAGTTAQVFFQLTSETTGTDVRLAKDIQRMAFRRNGIDTFIMAVPERLGKLTHLRIWHDNTGPSPSWYLSRMQIMDVQTGEQFFFIVENWLAVEEGDGQVERIVPVAGKNDLTDFNQLFWQKSQKNLFDGHIWFSVFRRPPRSHFTRVQRLTCCLSLIYCTMVANILFYKTNNAQANDIILSIGPITMTWTSLLTGIYAALIVAPVNAVLVLLFRYAKPIPIKSPMQTFVEKQKQMEKNEKREQKKLLKQKQKAQNKTDPGVSEQELVDMDQNPTAENLEDNETPLNQASQDYSHAADTSGSCKITIEPPKVVHIDTRAKKKKFWLPHWFIYVGYALAFVTVGVAFWLIMQIAFGFGKTKALDWVIAMFVSLIQSIIFIQPIKIIAIAIVYSCLCKKPEKDEYEPAEIELREDEVYVHEDLDTINDMKDSARRLAILQKLKRTRNAMPPELQFLQNARELRLKEMAMWALIREIFFYAVFLYTLMMVAYGERDMLTFPMIQNAQNIFVTGSAYGYNSNVTQFTSIQKPGEFFDWAEQALLTGLFPTSKYNNVPLPANERYIYDGQGYLTGTVRLRQLRIKPNSCKVSSTMKHLISHCRSPYSVGEEDWDEYKTKWVPMDPNNTNDVPDDLFTWKSMGKLKEQPFIGIVSSYWGGGFVADLGYEGDTAAAMLTKLKSTSWLDAYTRAVFVEFNVFYPTINLLLISNMLVEFMASGGATIFPDLHSLCLVPYSGPNATAVIIGQVVCVIFLFYFIYKQIRLLMKEKLKYFFSFWNWLEMLVIGLLFTALVMYVLRLNLRTSAVAAYKEKPNDFTSFRAVLAWEQIYSWMLYIVLFIANVKFLRLLRFNRRISLIMDTIKYGWRYVLAFFASFFLVFMAFTCFSFILFGSSVLDYMSFLNTIESLLVVMLNVFVMSDFSVGGIYGGIFFVVYTMTVNFILVNMFLSIVNDSFSVVKAESLEKTNQYELIDFIWNKFKKTCGFESNDINNIEGRQIYAEEQDAVELNLNDCHDKMDLMFIRMDDFFKEEKIDEKLKEDWRYQNSIQDGSSVHKHIVITE